MARYLVTGAAGFIGSNLCFGLLEQGHEVVAVDNLQTGSAQNLQGFTGDFYAVDVTVKGSLSGKFDGIFHHGDITDPRFPDDAVVLKRNVSGFQNLLDLAKQTGASLIYASTAGLYGNGPTPMREDQQKHILTAYGKSKSQMDALAAEAGPEVHVVGLRYFNVFGPRESHKGRAASMVYHLRQQMKQGKRPRLFNFGDQIRDFVYVKDVVRANLLALNAPNGVYNVGTGRGSTFNELVDCLNVALKTSLTPEYFEMPYDPATYQENTQASIELAAEKMGYQPDWPLQKAVSDYMEWLDASSDRNQ